MSGTALALGLACATALMAGGTVPVCAALVTSAATAGAADAAALAAADSASGRQPGSPCAAAESLASANGVALVGCTVDGSVATVTVQRLLGVLPVSATATAGPPP